MGKVRDWEFTKRFRRGAGGAADSDDAAADDSRGSMGKREMLNLAALPEAAPHDQQFSASIALYRLQARFFVGRLDGKTAQRL
jgi:hypothetical protein